MRQKVDPAVLEPQMPQKRLHDAGLLKYGVVMWSLREGKPTDTGWSHECTRLPGWPLRLTHPHPSTLLTGLSLKPKPKKSRAITRWNLSVRPSQIYKKERGDLHFCVLPLLSSDLHQQEFYPFFNLTDFTKGKITRNHHRPTDDPLGKCFIPNYESLWREELQLFFLTWQWPSQIAWVFYSLTVNEKQFCI